MEVAGKCEQCQENFLYWKRPSDSFRKYCCNQCQLVSLRIQQTKGKEVVGICKKCSEKFLYYLPLSELKQNFARQFCSKQCRYAHMRGTHEYALGGRTSIKVTVPCDYCGKPLIISENECKLYKHHFCDESHCNKWKKGKPFTEVMSPEIDEKDRRQRISKTLTEGFRSGRVHVNRNYKHYNPSKLELFYIDGLTKAGLKKDKDFVTQKLIGTYTVDVFFPEARLINPVNGSYWHADPRIYPKEKLDKIQRNNVVYDKKREIFFREKGFTVKKVWEKDIKQNRTKVVEEILTFYKYLKKRELGE